MTDTTLSPTASASTGGSVEDAAKAVERLLSQGEKQPRRSRPETSEAPAEAPVDQTEEDEGEENEADETSDEGDEPETDEAENSTDAPDEDAGEDEPEDKVYTVKVDGKEIQVPLDELLKGYSRTADYTRKTEALAHERRSFQAEVEQVKTERGQYSQLLPALVQQLQESLPKPPDPALRQTDPLRYVLDKDEYEGRVGRLNAAFSELQRVQQVQVDEQIRQLSTQVEHARAKLPELVPEWKDAKVYEREKPQLRAFLKDMGYSDEELDQAYDPRALALARMAWKQKTLLSSRPRPDAPLEKALRPTPSTQAARPPSEKQASRDARSRLAKTGRIDDAAAAIRSLL